MKKVFFSAVLIAATSLSSNAQLKVNSNGNVCLGATNPNDYYSTTIQQRSSSYGYGGLAVRGVDQSKNLHVGQYTNNAHFGSNTDAVAFFHWYASYNKAYAQAWYTSSDRNIKSNIQTLEGGLSQILKLRGVSYNLNEDLEKGVERTVYGFISQEVAEILPELTSEMMDVLCMDYTQIIPFLVSGIQEQQAQIESQNEQIVALNSELDELRELVFRIGEFTGMDLSNENIKPAAILYQNKPNPFKERTTVQYELPEEFNSASIMVFDMSGVMLETYPLTSRDGGELTIEGKKFKPGMYLYSLIVDDVEIDTKKMILSK